MPADLFGSRSDIRSPFTRSRRSPLLVSVVVHTAVFAAIAAASLSAGLTLPLPHERLAFVDSHPLVRMADIELPRPKTVAPRSAESSFAAPVAVAYSMAAPVEAPDGIALETGLETGLKGSERGEPGGLAAFPGIPGGQGLGDGLRGVLESALPVAPRQPVRLHSGIQTPVKIGHVDPVYPPHALNLRLQGVVILEAVIDASGVVESIRVLRSVPMLDRAAVDAVRQWRYKPALLNGGPVPVFLTLTVNFTIGPR